MISKINIQEKFLQINDYWNPRISGELNDSYIKMVKIKGEFIWHHHDDEDEMFFVCKGNLVIRFRDREIALNEGEFLVIPKGIEHQPIAEEEVHLLLIEPKTTLNTGNVVNERTVSIPERMDEH
ncbi:MULTISPECIES: cupin domain-containing protein [Bacillus]|uniref:Cupin domain-containing protein n=1 Tax=Bacillus pumilus TaxID=1408 RepID=A0AAE4B6A2_BACPU|nr:MULTISPECIES: cupin domain-containing protein [Bacillus]AZV52050.1 cupin domain-containing protein [Bacillus pumilus]MBR0586447.1 cupin domain-containing protein [Bacillus pumilus DW2J2]MBR0617845.1 cupin domain-containing protein [Bacillus pumilus]MBR0623096.1 cupin domain-containing protein [Bacillus pumilus]MBU5259680.1 cupin domain-containing protein [Bacillus pumilus]